MIAYVFERQLSKLRKHIPHIALTMLTFKTPAPPS